MVSSVTAPPPAGRHSRANARTSSMTTRAVSKSQNANRTYQTTSRTASTRLLYHGSPENTQPDGHFASMSRFFHVRGPDEVSVAEEEPALGDPAAIFGGHVHIRG